MSEFNELLLLFYIFILEASHYGSTFLKAKLSVPLLQIPFATYCKKEYIYIYIYIKGSYSLSRNKRRELDHIQPIQIDLAKLLSKT